MHEAIYYEYNHLRPTDRWGHPTPLPRDAVRFVAHFNAFISSDKLNEPSFSVYAKEAIASNMFRVIDAQDGTPVSLFAPNDLKFYKNGFIKEAYYIEKIYHPENDAFEIPTVSFLGKNPQIQLRTVYKARFLEDGSLSYFQIASPFNFDAGSISTPDNKSSVEVFREPEQATNYCVQLDNYGEGPITININGKPISCNSGSATIDARLLSAECRQKKCDTELPHYDASARSSSAIDE